MEHGRKFLCEIATDRAVNTHAVVKNSNVGSVVAPTRRERNRERIESYESYDVDFVHFC